MFWGLWVTLLILWMGRFVTSFLSMYLVSDMHVSAGVAGTIVSMYGFGGIFGCLYGGALSDRFGRPAMIVIGNLGSAAMLVLLAFIGNPWIMAIALLAYGAISSMPTPRSRRTCPTWCRSANRSARIRCRRGPRISASRSARSSPTSW